MKIVHVVETWIGGIASYVRALIAEQQHTGHSVVLVCDLAQLSVADLGIDGIEIIHYRSSRNPLRVPAIALELKRIIHSAKADVVHCHSTFPGLYVRLCRFDEERIFYTPHAWSFMKKDLSRPIRHVYAFVERALARRCSRILCMSFDEVRSARRHGILLSKIDLVYTGIASDSEYTAGVRDTASSRVSSAQAPASIKVGYFGRLDYQKGFDILLDAIPRLKDGISVHVFGAAVRGGVPISESNPRITYHGWVGPDEARLAMRSVDAIVVPSRWEGLALVPIEAMRAGKVLIVSNEGSLPEQVIHGYNGLMLRELTGGCLAEQLNSLTFEECKRMGNNARHVFDHAFRADKFFKTLMDRYESA